MKKIRNILIICVLTMFMIPLYSKAQTINLKSSNKNDMVKPGDKIDIIISKDGMMMDGSGENLSCSVVLWNV